MFRSSLPHFSPSICHVTNYNNWPHGRSQLLPIAKGAHSSPLNPPPYAYDWPNDTPTHKCYSGNKINVLSAHESINYCILIPDSNILTDREIDSIITNFLSATSTCSIVDHVPGVARSYSYDVLEYDKFKRGQLHGHNLNLIVLSTDSMVTTWSSMTTSW